MADRHVRARGRKSDPYSDSFLTELSKSYQNRGPERGISLIFPSFKALTKISFHELFKIVFLNPSTNLLGTKMRPLVLAHTQHHFCLGAPLL